MAHLLKQVEGLAKREGVSFCLVSPILSTVDTEGVHFVRAFWSPHGHWSQMPVSIVFCDCKCFFVKMDLTIIVHIYIWCSLACCSGLPMTVSLQTT